LTGTDKSQERIFWKITIIEPQQWKSNAM